MRLIATCFFVLSATAATAGSLSSDGRGVFRCTDDATTQIFEVRFTGATCSVDGISGETRSRGVCATPGRNPEVFTLSNRNTFSLINTRTNGVLDGRCF